MARRSRVSRAALLCCVALATLVGLTIYKAAASSAFVGLRSRTLGSISRQAEGKGKAAPAPAPESGGALVKIDEANVKATGSVLAGLAGLLVGGLWVGAGLFAAASYAGRKDDDVGKAIKGVSQTALEALNFTANMDSKYKVTDNLGKSVSSAVEKNVKSEDKATLDSAVNTVSGSVADLDKEVGIKATLGSIVLTATDLSAQAVEKLLDFNEKNKVTDKLAEQASNLASKAKDATKKE
mmetsp:Transcript_52912/g.97902  ORF Transcript_52912/g.97902 Transcript_52912/m.97902 type:complete len:239 (-) Transcript_52912:65-781(-)